MDNYSTQQIINSIDELKLEIKEIFEDDSGKISEIRDILNEINSSIPNNNIESIADNLEQIEHKLDEITTQLRWLNSKTGDSFLAFLLRSLILAVMIGLSVSFFIRN